MQVQTRHRRLAASKYSFPISDVIVCECGEQTQFPMDEHRGYYTRGTTPCPSCDRSHKARDHISLDTNSEWIRDSHEELFSLVHSTDEARLESADSRFSHQSQTLLTAVTDILETAQWTTVGDPNERRYEPGSSDFCIHRIDVYPGASYNPNGDHELFVGARIEIDGYVDASITPCRNIGHSSELGMTETKLASIIDGIQAALGIKKLLNAVSAPHVTDICCHIDSPEIYDSLTGDTRISITDSISDPDIYRARHSLVNEVRRRAVDSTYFELIKESANPAQQDLEDFATKGPVGQSHGNGDS